MSDFKITVEGCSAEEYEAFVWALENEDFCVDKKGIHCPLNSYAQQRCRECLDEVFQYKKPKEWKPKLEEQYFYIDPIGDICTSSWANLYEDHEIYRVGNCFRTYEEAEASDLYKAYKR